MTTQIYPEHNCMKNKEGRLATLIMHPCKERIKNNLIERITDFDEALKADDNMHTSGDETFEINGAKYESFLDWLNSYILAYTDDPVLNGKRLELSYYGPQEYFLFLNDGSISYHILGLFDGADIKLHGYDLLVMREVKDIIEEKYIYHHT